MILNGFYLWHFYAVEFVVDDWFDEELPAGVAHAAASGVHSTAAWD